MSLKQTRYANLFFYLGYAFENKIYNVLIKNTDFRVNLTKPVQGDNGVDIILFYKNFTVLIQCKNLASNVSNKYVKDFITTVNHYGTENILGIMISIKGFGGNAHNLVKECKNILLLSENDHIFISIQKIIISSIISRLLKFH